MLPLVLLLAGPSISGGEILEARLEAAVGGGRDVAVRIAYRIGALEVDRVAFSALEIDGVAVDEVSAFSAEGPLLLSLDPRSGPKLEGSIVIPQRTTAFELRYVVRGGAEPTDDELRVRLPCAVLDLKLKDTRSGLFSSTIELPAGLSVTDGFPSNPVAVDGGYRWELPLVPAFVAFRASPGTVLLTPPRVATTAVVVLLLGMGLVGIWKARAPR